MITANEYFEGNVKSLGYNAPEGNSTIGVMEPGDYKFSTSAHETMIVIEGELQATLPDSDQKKSFKAGERFEVPANSSFLVTAVGQTSYLCKYE